MLGMDSGRRAHPTRPSNPVSPSSSTATTTSTAPPPRFSSRPPSNESPPKIPGPSHLPRPAPPPRGLRHADRRPRTSRRAGVRLVISVDTGIRAFAAAEEARALGINIIVTDHHLPDDAMGVPEAVAVLNPAQANCPYPFNLCGAAVAYKLAHALLLVPPPSSRRF